MPTASPAPAPTTVPVIAILEQVAEAETALRSGELEATLDHSEGVRSFSTVRFDLGDEQQVPRLHMTSIYESAEGPQTFERIMIGTTAWERQPDGAWIEVSGQVVVWDQVQTFLPHARSGANPQLTVASDTAELRWDDPSRDADVTLLLDPDTTIPRELRRLIRTTGAVLTVRYIGWNTPVEITPPEGT